MITKKMFVSILLSSTLLLSFIKDPECKDFKTGNFILLDSALNDSFLIQRNDSIQTEIDYASGDTSVFRISWINQCSYTLSILKGPDFAVKFFNNRYLNVYITQLYANGYKFEASFNGSTVRFTKTIKKIQD